MDKFYSIHLKTVKDYLNRLKLLVVSEEPHKSRTYIMNTAANTNSHIYAAN